MFRATAIAMALGLAAFGVARAESAPSVGRCVSFDQDIDEDAQSVTLRLGSACAEEVACTMRWKVDCDDDDKDRHEARSFSLAAKGSEVIDASASVCGDGDWGVVDVRWTCDTIER